MKIKTASGNAAKYKVRNNYVVENDPICQLTKNFGKIAWNTLLLPGVHNKCCFKVSTIINGNKVAGVGTTLEMAKRLCALKALNQIQEVKITIGGQKHITARKVISDVGKGLPIVSAKNEEQNCTQSERNKKMHALHNITNLQLKRTIPGTHIADIESNLYKEMFPSGEDDCNQDIDRLPAYNEQNFNISDRNEKFTDDSPLNNTPLPKVIQEIEYDQNTTNPEAYVAEIGNNQDNKINSSILRLAVENKNDCNVAQNALMVIKNNEKVSIGWDSLNPQPIVIEQIKNKCVKFEQSNDPELPSCSRLQPKCGNMDVNTQENSFPDLGSMLRKKLNLLKATTQNSTNGDLISVQTIEMKVNIKSFAKNAIGDTNLLSNQVSIKNVKQSLKRHREENSELSEQPPAKIRAIAINDVLPKQRQWCSQKDAIINLNMLRPNLNFYLEAKVGNINEPYYMVSAMEGGRKFFGHGKTEQEAARDTAIQILNFLENKTDQFRNNDEPPKLTTNNQNCQQLVLHNDNNNALCSSLLLQSNHADIIESKIMQAFDRLTSGQAEFRNYKVLAGILMTSHMNFDNSKVVSIATGTKCINGGNICCNGSVLNDSHAEVIAKRGLMKFLFTQLKNHCSYHTIGDSVFERTPKGYKLKSYLHFHLYINTAPCGDARVFNFNQQNQFNNSFNTSFNNSQYGKLRTKVEGKMGTSPIGSRFYPQTWDGVVLGEPLHTMSCSDKIALWNVVGIQGALLSQFIEPIYLRSITLGSLFNAQHMYRAVCGRIQDTLGHLPKSYHLNRPLLGQTTKLFRRCTLTVPGIGINWTCGDNGVEIIYLPTGRSVYNETSFLSKQAFFFKYFYLCNNLPNANCAYKSNIYAEAKQKAQNYQNAKKVVYEAFHRAELGLWVKKPKEQNEFMMNFS